jgi:hypothetical protein
MESLSLILVPTSWSKVTKQELFRYGSRTIACFVGKHHGNTISKCCVHVYTQFFSSVVEIDTNF